MLYGNENDEKIKLCTVLASGKFLECFKAVHGLLENSLDFGLFKKKSKIGPQIF